MLPELESLPGFLPVGRFPCREEEIAARFVNHEDFLTSTTRREIWSHWDAAKRFVSDRVRVYAVWMAGSFLTAKLDPGDLDITWIIDGESLERLDGYAQAEILPFLQGRDGAAVHGLRIDSYGLIWRCHAMPGPEDLHNDLYFGARGYWDDWWMRARTGPKGAPAKAADARPRRGYVEVALREYG